MAVHEARRIRLRQIDAAGSNPSPAMTRSFDSLTTGASAQDATNGLSYINNVTTTVDDVTYYGDNGKSCKCAMVATQVYVGGNLSLPRNMVNNDELWVRYRQYVPAGFSWYDAGIGHTKHLRIGQMRGALGEYRSYISGQVNETSGPMTGYRVQNEAFAPAIDDNTAMIFTTNTWQTLEMYVKFSDSSGIVRMWLDGVRYFNQTGYATLANVGDYCPEIRFLDYWNSGAPGTQNLWIDDIQIWTNDAPPVQLDSSGYVYAGLV